VLILFSGLVIATGSYNTFIHSVSIARTELVYSLIIAVAVILISLPLALAAAFELKKPGLRGSAAWALVLLPLAVPGSLAGIGMATFWNAAGASGGYPGLFLPVLVGIARFAPVTAIILFVQLRFIDPILFDAADVFSFSIMRNWTEIRLPLLAPGLFVAAGILVCLTLGELGGTLVVAPPGHATLTMRIYNYLHYGASGEVAGLCLMITILTLVVSIVTITAVVFLYKNAGHNRKRGV
jgi:iron(III) transport system permease protein